MNQKITNLYDEYLRVPLTPKEFISRLALLTNSSKEQPIVLQNETQQVSIGVNSKLNEETLHTDIIMNRDQD